MNFHDVRDEPGPEVVLQKADILERAEVFLAAAGGLPGGVSLDIARVDHIHREIAVWMLRWRRRLGEYGYGHDGVVMMIAPDTGKLVGMGILWYSQEPASLALNVSREQAVALARQYAATDAPVRETRLLIVNPELFQKPLTEAARTATNMRSVLGWIISFNDRVLTSVVLNAGEGSLIGTGRVHRLNPLPGAAEARSNDTTDSVRILFQRAERIELVEVPPEAHDRGKVLASMSRHQQPDVIAQLAPLVGWDSDYRPRESAPCQLRVTADDGQVVTLDYYPQIRLILSGDTQKPVSARVRPGFDDLLGKGEP